MIDIIEIPIKEFEDKIYDEYIKLFPDEEQRDWDKIELAYSKGIEKFYKIDIDGKIIGFILLERIDENYPYYLDYFAIYSDYQNKGYGSMAIKKLLENAILDKGLIGEVEKVKEDELNTKKRFEFYKRLGFEKINSEYLLYGVLYNPIAHSLDKTNKDEIDQIFMDYYKTNVGEEEFNKHCRIIK